MIYLAAGQSLLRLLATEEGQAALATARTTEGTCVMERPRLFWPTTAVTSAIIGLASENGWRAAAFALVAVAILITAWEDRGG